MSAVTPNEIIDLTARAFNVTRADICARAPAGWEPFKDIGYLARIWLRENIFRAYDNPELNYEKHVEAIQAIFNWIKTGRVPGAKPALEVHAGGKVG